MNTNKTNHKEILILIIVIFVLLISFYIIKTNNLNYTELKIINFSPNENLNPECVGLEKNQKASCIIKNSICNTDDCYSKQAKLMLNESQCFNIVDENLRISCTSYINYNGLIQKAVLTDDILVCNQLDISGQIPCKNNYYYVKSINNNEKVLCENIIDREDLKNECLSN